VFHAIALDIKVSDRFYAPRDCNVAHKLPKDRVSVVHPVFWKSRASVCMVAADVLASFSSLVHPLPPDIYRDDVSEYFDYAQALH
jgi:hypothetical protein